MNIEIDFIPFIILFDFIYLILKYIISRYRSISLRMTSVT